MKDSIGTEGDRRHAGPEDLAAEYLVAAEDGRVVDEAPFLARLATAEQRAEFHALVAAAHAAQRKLPRALAPGTRVRGRYRLLAEIGSGGMGRVFAAYDEELERKVAIKMLTALHAGDPAREELFQRESLLLAALSHPGIVAVHEAGCDGDLSFLVMDLVDGTSLSEVIERARIELVRSGAARPSDGALLTKAIGKGVAPGRPNVIVPGDWCASVAAVVLELARTLEAAHGAQVVHRDLKPGNVMLLGGGSPVVLDFGLAGSITAITNGAVTRGLYGSIPYLAPEQLRTQQAGADPRTDVYQLGLILYELLTLRRAFPVDGMGDAIARIRAGELLSPRKHNRDVPRDLEAICMMALELEPSQRYANAGEMRADLERFLGGSEVPRARRGSGLRAIARRTRHGFRRRPFLAALLAATLVVAGVYAYLPRREPVLLTQFLRLDSATRQVVPIPERDSVVRVKDSLGVHLECATEMYVYGLSVFSREDGRKLVSPYRPALATNLERRDKPDEPFALVVPAGSWDLVISVVDRGSTIEGLQVYASEVERPELEGWLAQLAEIQLRNDDGMPYSDAVDLFKTRMRTARGVSGRFSWSPEERAAIRAMLEAQKSQPPSALDLPGVHVKTLECHVAGD